MFTKGHITQFAAETLRDNEVLKKTVATTEERNADLVKALNELRAKNEATERELEALKLKTASKKKRKQAKQAPKDALLSVETENEAKHNADTALDSPQIDIPAAVEEPNAEPVLVDASIAAPAENSTGTASVPPYSPTSAIEPTIHESKDDQASTDSKSEDTTTPSSSQSSSATSSPKKSPKKAKRNKKPVEASPTVATDNATAATVASAPKEPTEDEEAQKKRRLQMDPHERKMDRRQRVKNMRAHKEMLANEQGSLRFLLHTLGLQQYCAPNCGHEHHIRATGDHANHAHNAEEGQQCC